MEGGIPSAGRFDQLSEPERREYWASLAMRHCRGLGHRSITKLLWRYGSAYNALDAVDEWEILGVRKDCIREIQTGSWRESAKVEWDKAKKINAGILVWNNPIFPAQLREIPDSPAILYFIGDIALLKSPAIGIVGSRNALSRNLQIAENLGKYLSDCGITVISGMALGIDSCAHTGALKGIGKSIGILGTGINIHYPLANRDLYGQMAREGLLLSEFEPGTPPGNRNFPIRNRLISGISLGVIVVEAAEKSGSLITAKLALEQNREVFAIPGQPLSNESPGCQNLIREGAHPVFSFPDILENLSDSLRAYQNIITGQMVPQPKINYAIDCSLQAQKPQKPAPGPILDTQVTEKVVSKDNSAKILEIIGSHENMQVEELARLAEMSAQELNPILIIMEIQGKIKRLSGANYTLVDDRCGN